MTVLRQNENSNCNLTSSMNDKMNFSCSMLKECDETDKSCDEDLSCKMRDCVTEVRSEWLYRFMLKVKCKVQLT